MCLSEEIKCSGFGCPLKEECSRTLPLPDNQMRMRQSFMSPIYDYIKERCTEFIDRTTP
jgi:hypothetical protein